MRKVDLRMNEQYKYQIIKKLVETNGNKKRAAIKLKRSVRQINRMIAGYKEFGKEFFVHGNRGRKPVKALTEEFKTEIEFILRKKSGGQWIYNILLESTEPEPDDIIYIRSSIGKQSFVSFKLNNIFTKEIKFTAYFSHESSSEFSVTPREGILDQMGKEGTQFVICYLPVEYGKIKIGKLIIETDEVQWIFEVRGAHLDYKPPEIKKTHLYEQTKSSEFKMIGFGTGTEGK